MRAQKIDSKAATARRLHVVERCATKTTNEAIREGTDYIARDISQDLWLLAKLGCVQRLERRGNVRFYIATGKAYSPNEATDIAKGRGRPKKVIEEPTNGWNLGSVNSIFDMARVMAVSA